LNQDNLGISAAKNIGASISKGKYIAFLDADDKWSKHYLLKMRKLIEKYPNSSAYVSGYRCVNKTQKWNVIFNSKKKDGIVKNYFESRRKNWGVHTSSVIFKRSIFFENKGFPTLIYSQKKNESLLVDIEGKIINKFKNLKPMGEMKPFKYNLNKNKNLKKYKDLQFELPGALSEDQFLHDKIAIKKDSYAFTKSILSTWYGNIKNQSTKSIFKKSPLKANYFYIKKLYLSKKTSNKKKIEYKNYLKYLTQNIISRTKNFSKKEQNYYFRLLEIFKIWDVESILFFKVKIFIFKLMIKFNQ